MALLRVLVQGIEQLIDYTGWFHLQSTTEFYDVPRTARDPELVEMAGGALGE